MQNEHLTVQLFHFNGSKNNLFIAIKVKLLSNSI